MSTAYENKKVALDLAKRPEGVTADEWCKKIDSKSPGAMKIQLNRMVAAKILTETEEKREGKIVFRAEEGAELPPEPEKKPRKPRAKKEKKNAGSQKSTREKKRVSRKKGAQKTEKGKEKALDTALRLGVRKKGFTLQELAEARGSKDRVGPFKRTLNRAIGMGVIREERHEDQVRYYTTGQAPSRTAIQDSEGKQRSELETPVSRVKPTIVEPLNLEAKDGNTLKSVAGILESFANFLRQQADE